MPVTPSQIQAVSKALMPLIRPHVVPTDYRARVVALIEDRPDADPADIARTLAAEITSAAVQAAEIASAAVQGA